MTRGLTVYKLYCLSAQTLTLDFVLVQVRACSSHSMLIAFFPLFSSTYTTFNINVDTPIYSIMRVQALRNAFLYSFPPSYTIWQPNTKNPYLRLIYECHNLALVAPSFPNNLISQLNSSPFAQSTTPPHNIPLILITSFRVFPSISGVDP